MAIDTNLGSITPGRKMYGGEAIRDVIENIEVSLDAVNDKSDANAYKKTELGLIQPFIMNYFGENGKTIAFENYQIKFQNYNANSNPSVPNPTRKTLSLYSQAFEVSNGSFTQSWFREIDKTDGDPYKEINDQTDAIMNVYENVFKPNFTWQALLQVPTSGSDFYAQPGALRDVVVDKSLLKSYKSGAAAGGIYSNTKLHWAGIEGAQIAGSDLKYVKQYLNNYKGVNPSKIMGMGNMGSLHQLEEVFDDAATRDQLKLGSLEFEGMTAYGMKFAMTDMLPENILMFVVADEFSPFIARLENKKEQYRGMTFVPEKSFDKYGNNIQLENLSGKFIIEDIGDALWGRYRVFFLDITPDRYAANTTYTPDALLYTEVTAKQTDLRNEWKVSGVIDKL